MDEKIVEMIIKLDLDYSSAGSPGSLGRIDFEKHLTEDLAKASNLPSKSFRIKNMSKGSIIVDLQVHPDSSGVGPDPSSAIGDLVKQVKDTNSRLKFGSITFHTTIIELKGQREISRSNTPPGIIDASPALLLEGPHALPKSIEFQESQLQVKIDALTAEKLAWKQILSDLKVHYEKARVVHEEEVAQCRVDLIKKAEELETCQKKLHTANEKLDQHIQAMEAQDEELVFCQSALKSTNEEAQRTHRKQIDIESQSQKELSRATEKIVKLSQHLDGERDSCEKRLHDMNTELDRLSLAMEAKDVELLFYQSELQTTKEEKELTHRKQHDIELPLQDGLSAMRQAIDVSKNIHEEIVLNLQKDIQRKIEMNAALVDELRHVKNMASTECEEQIATLTVDHEAKKAQLAKEWEGKVLKLVEELESARVTHIEQTSAMNKQVECIR